MDDITSQASGIGSQAKGLSTMVDPSAVGAVSSMFSAFAEDALNEIREMLAAIQVVVSLFKTIVGLAKCSTIQRVVFQLADDLCMNDKENAGLRVRLEDVVQLESSVISALLICWMAIGMLMFVLGSPRKPWACHTCGNHYRFKVSLKAHRKVTCKEGQACFTMPIKYSSLTGTDMLIPPLKQALRADLASQVISIATDLGFPE
jgi:hypothetical protein